MKPKQNYPRLMAIALIPKLIACFAISLGIWGLALNKNVLWFAIAGVIIGLLIGIISTPVISKRKKIINASEMVFSVGYFWGGTCALIGMSGLAVWLIRIIFFH